MPTDITSDAEPGAGFSWGERAAWVLFLATSLHLAFLQPWVEVIPGERAKVFSGIWLRLDPRAGPGLSKIQNRILEISRGSHFSRPAHSGSRQQLSQS